jgi:hypothetical protein
MLPDHAPGGEATNRLVIVPPDVMIPSDEIKWLPAQEAGCLGRFKLESDQKTGALRIIHEVLSLRWEAMRVNQQTHVAPGR